MQARGHARKMLANHLAQAVQSFFRRRRRMLSTGFVMSSAKNERHGWCLICRIRELRKYIESLIF